MFIVLLLALLCVPLLELYLIIQVADGVGTGQTILLLTAVSVVGAWMVRRSGLGVLNQIRARLSRGELPAGELVDGLLILVAGALMLTPGFLTDAVGLLLLFPPTRLVVRSLLVRRFAKKFKRAHETTENARIIVYGAKKTQRVVKDAQEVARDAQEVARDAKEVARDAKETAGSGWAAVTAGRGVFGFRPAAGGGRAGPRLRFARRRPRVRDGNEVSDVGDPEAPVDNQQEVKDRDGN